jgi:hypothetical protein
MEVIFKYSPFKTKRELFENFERIKSDSGTIVMIYNLKTNGDGETELDFLTDPQDILMRDINVDYTPK